MHMADALVSPPVAAVAGVAAASLLVVATGKVAKSNRTDIIPLMGVMGAFVFAAQMINFSIPGTGSSGHIIGGVLLAAMLGPWAAYLTLCSVLIVQCLVFADGGLMALGCNMINMAAVSTLIGYPLVYRPLVKYPASTWRIMLGAVSACVLALEAGALLVSAETVASGITALPLGKFLIFMLPIHLAIGVCEGVATGLVVTFVQRYNAPLLTGSTETAGTIRKSGGRRKHVLWAFGIAALVLAVAFTWIASSNPDGLEWSIEKVAGVAELAPATTPATALMPDYASHFAGIVGGVLVMATLWAVTTVIFRRRRHTAAQRLK
ncbi:MAG: energy-coupling factor ABC transporter permease [Muribaculaceae bacterium]|nr:energy-coupling factor ABC transporter permease [Muribaculaceae bacterium]